MNYPTNIRWIRRLIWAYFWLLLFEGVLRKWVVPSLSTPLLVVRAPIVIAIYALAIQARVFPLTRWVLCCLLLAFLGLFAGLYVLQDAPIVALFGFQADFLHLPLIFIIPRVFDMQDVRKVGFWTLVMCIPMAVLMALQFKANPTALINAGAGGDATQLAATNGHIRPAGLFTFITGPSSFFPLAVAFLLSGIFASLNYPRWLLIASTLALIVGAGVSSSRGLVSAVVVVLVCALVAGIVFRSFLISGRTIMRAVSVVASLAVIGMLVSHLDVFSEGLATFGSRIQIASGGEANTGGFTGRILTSFAEPFELLGSTPALGNGLGLGTNAGSALVNTGKVKYMLAETEWDRVILESGPVLGLAYLLLRVVLLVWLGWMSARLARQGNVLPFLLLASCAPLLIQGQFGQPTELGFAVFGSGLALAAMHVFPSYQNKTADVSPTENNPRAEVAA